MSLDKIRFCNLSLKPRDLRRSIKCSEEDPIVPRAFSERLMNHIYLWCGCKAYNDAMIH